MLPKIDIVKKEESEKFIIDKDELVISILSIRNKGS